MNDIKILITSPSLNTHENVSGISTLVSGIIQHSTFNIKHFLLGSKDGEKKNINWVIKQLITIARFIKESKGSTYNVLHINTGLEKFSIYRDSLLVFIAKRLFNKKVLLHIHGGYFLFNNPKSLTAFCIKSLLSNADKLVVLSEDEKKELGQRYKSFSFHVLPNAINYCIDVNKEFGRDNNIELLFLGRINESKGIDTITDSLLQLNGELKQLNLKIFGAGPALEKWLEDLSNVNGLTYQYCGIADDESKWKAFEEADVFLLPSLHSEGLPIAMLEAMAAGCTVITTDDGSITSVAKPNNSIVIPKDSPGVLAEKLTQVVKGLIDLKQLGQNAQEYVREHLLFPSYMKRLEEIYRSI